VAEELIALERLVPGAAVRSVAGAVRDGHNGALPRAVYSLVAWEDVREDCWEVARAVVARDAHKDGVPRAAYSLVAWEDAWEDCSEVARALVTRDGQKDGLLRAACSLLAWEEARHGPRDEVLIGVWE
jgi:hypothetical protein